MSLTPLKFTAVALLTCFVLASQAASAATMNQPKPAWHWLTEDDKAALLKSIPPAPAPGSALDQQDLQAVLQLQSTRTPQDIAEAQDDKKFRLEIISRVLDQPFTKKSYPIAFALLDKVNQDEYFLNITLKKEYQRPRPFEGHSEVKALFPVDGYSYPSGHTSGAYTLAEMLAVFFPDKKDALLARAAAVGRSRIVAGVHYPSDVDEGKKLADALVAALLANAAFQKDLAPAQAEVARLKGP